MYLCFVLDLQTLNVTVEFRVLGFITSCSLNLLSENLNFIYGIDLLHSQSFSVFLYFVFFEK